MRKLRLPISIWRKDKENTPLPRYATEGSVGFDLAAARDTECRSHAVALIPTGLYLKVEPGYMLMIAPRSSIARSGLIFPHSVGIVDQDYCGPQDELLVQVYNTTPDDIVVLRGTRVAQGIFVRIVIADWVEHASQAIASRGGFGSTGV